jgi:hypothetical protein
MVLFKVPDNESLPVDVVLAFGVGLCFQQFPLPFADGIFRFFK